MRTHFDYEPRPVPAEVQMQLFGFARSQCTDSTWITISFDPVVRERIAAVCNSRRASLGVMAENIFGPYYAQIPARGAEADLANIISEDDASTFNVIRNMTAAERSELRERVLDEKLQAGLRKASAQSGEHDNYAFYKMSAEQKLAAARELA
jgi:hypothetical protein